MIEFMLFCLNIAWKVLGLVFGWYILTYVVRNGAGTFRTIMDTIFGIIKLIGIKIRRMVVQCLQREAEEASKETKAEGTVE